MRGSSLLGAVSVFQLNTITLAHGADDGLPAMNVFGGRSALRHLPRHMLEEVSGYASPHLKPGEHTKRGKTSKKCGPGAGFCDPGDCCSPVGFCGRGPNYCESPNCQFEYSDGCDSSVKPLGDSTLNVSRPLIGNVTYGGDGILACQNSGAVALTFDDGPYNFTSHVLDVLGAYGAKATFFITGNNLAKGQIDVEENGWPSIIRRMHAEGHQIAGHSWGHANLSSLNDTELVNEVHYLEMALRNILGFIPTYFRPPYDDCQENCQRILLKMGYHITYQNIVNNDWQDDDGIKIESAKDSFLKSMNKTNPHDVNNIFLLHDTHYQTSWNLTDYMLNYFEIMNYSSSVTIGECMGDPPENWYRAAGGAPNRTLLLRKSHGNTLQYSTLQYSTLFLIFGQIMSYMYL